MGLREYHSKNLVGAVTASKSRGLKKGENREGGEYKTLVTKKGFQKKKKKFDP